MLVHYYTSTAAKHYYTYTAALSPVLHTCLHENSSILALLQLTVHTQAALASYTVAMLIVTNDTNSYHATTLILATINSYYSIV